MDPALRCPACNALVVDRRFAQCTTCHAELPKDWILSPEQMAKLGELDQHARAEHTSVMEQLAPESDPNTPLLTRDDDPSNSH